MRSISITAPALMLGYGIARWLDGLDGQRHNGPAWTIGHVMFFAAMVLFAAQAFGLAWRGRDRMAVALPALAATVFGAGCFLWVIIGDLFRSFDHPLPAPIAGGGPALFVIGMVTLLGLQSAARRLPWWSPAAFLAGFVAVSVDLDLLPWAAVLILAGSIPLARRLPIRPGERTAEAAGAASSAAR
jgi:hypothetical protein